MNPVHIAIDIGGTWLKAVACAAAHGPQQAIPPAVRAPSLLGQGTADEFAARLAAVARHAADGRPVCGVGISTPGLVDYFGRRVTLCAAHLRPLDDPAWLARLEVLLDAPCALMNDAQAALCGAAESGLLPASGVVGLFTFGTGLGFVVWKNGKLWNPGRVLPLLGSVRTPAGRFDGIASASAAAASHPSGDLAQWLTDPDFAAARETYFAGLRGILATGAILYQLDTLLIGGGLAGAAAEAGVPLADLLALDPAELPELARMPRIIAASGGNTLNLIGAAALARGQASLQDLAAAPAPAFGQVGTEAALDATLHLEALPTAAILTLMQREETAAVSALAASLPALAPLIDGIAGKMARGGRIIYLGAGTSGRVAAMDAVEIPCTFGCAPHEVIALIAGGAAEAAESIESAQEEDASAIPDLLLAQPGPADTVIGISASGTARYVRSGLAFARARGATTLLIKESATAGLPGVDHVVALRSGPEIVQGSTRMKAGTATKRLLNAITTCVMIRRGKIRGTAMIEVQCLNAKLRDRACRILAELHGLAPHDAEHLLEQHQWHLRAAIEAMDAGSAGVR